MIPFIATVAIEEPTRRTRRFWIPLGVVWLLLLPLVLLLIPFFCLACVIVRIDPFRALGTIGQVLGSLKGMDLEVAGPRARVEMRLL
jgi:hypothetical protein